MESASGSASRIGGLDAMRAVAVAAVVLYHLWPHALPAGYLGVDVFMVVSGFIVTTLLLRERDRVGHIRIGAFWGRRFRRLVPALMLLLAVVAVWSRVVEPRAALPDIRGQGIAALLYVANWHLVSSGVSYGSAPAGASPFVHLWSLAVEEQFYFFWPLVLVALLWCSRGRRGLVIVAASAGAVASATLMALLYHPGRDPLRVYYGTDTRAQTFLIGAVAALIAPALRVRGRRVVARTGLAGLAVVATATAIAPATLLYRGGFAVVAIAAAVAVLASTMPSPLTTLLDHAPLRALGRVSYGVYLWHWPAIVLLTPARLGVTGPALAVARLAATAAGTAVSWTLVERPMAHLAPRRVVLRGAGVVGVATTMVVLLPATQVVAYADYRIDRMPALVVVPATPVHAAHPTKVRRKAAPTRREGLALPARGTAMLVGDSGMFSATPAFTAALNAAGWQVIETAYPGEGLTRPDGIRQHWADIARQHRVDLTIVMIGGWDQSWIADHGMPAYRSVVDDAVASFTSGGGKVLWLAIMPAGATSRTPDRALDHFFVDAAARHPGVVEYLETVPTLRGPAGDWPQVVDGRRLRQRDGWHLCPDGAAELAHYVLGHLALDRGDWTAGTWRSNARWTDPAEGCVAKQ